MKGLAVLLTVHNRKEKTLRALSGVFSQNGLDAKLRVKVFVVDDGSTDGTSAAIESQFPQVTLIQGTGNLYWNTGMHLSMRHAMAESFDYFLWLNDDVELFQTAFERLIITSEELNDQSIIAGSVIDPDSQQLTYGGVSRLDRGRLLKFTLIEPGEIPVRVETMNGNCVLIPKLVASQVGNLDSSFTHRIGDFDYGLRAKKMGVETFIAPGYYGYCPLNPFRERWKNTNLPFATRWKYLVSLHGLPPKEWAIFAKRYAGFFWWIFWLSPYVRMILSSLLHGSKRGDKI